jgi:predicted DNA-binding transcriptional regulator AlpA
LALRPKEAALALGISPRLLWSKTNCNEIPHVRIGRAVVYPVELLREWLTQTAKGGVK